MQQIILKDVLQLLRVFIVHQWYQSARSGNITAQQMLITAQQTLTDSMLQLLIGMSLNSNVPMPCI